MSAHFFDAQRQPDRAAPEDAGAAGDGGAAPDITDWCRVWQARGPDDACVAAAAAAAAADGSGRPEAAAALAMAEAWPRLYPELRRLAARLMARERDGHTLSPTALVHEAWLKLGAGEGGAGRRVNDRSHFFALATRAMRHILVNHAQARLAGKRRGDAAHETLSAADAVAVPSLDQPDALLALDQALKALAGEDARAAQVAELKAFGGLEVPEIARCLGVSEPTVKRDWVFARARLAQLLA